MCWYSAAVALGRTREDSGSRQAIGDGPAQQAGCDERAADGVGWTRSMGRGGRGHDWLTMPSCCRYQLAARGGRTVKRGTGGAGCGHAVGGESCIAARAVGRDRLQVLLTAARQARRPTRTGRVLRSGQDQRARWS